MILSIDVGIKNLAMCMFEPTTQTIIEWDVSGIPPEHKDGIYVSLREHLDAKPWVLDATIVLIEKQPDKNKKMKSVEHFLHAYFIIRNIKATTIIYDARNKVPDVAGPGRAQYVKRKNTSIERCRAFLETSPVNARWLPIFEASKKKDDLADTVMQALSFKHADTPVVVTKVSARKPTEHQKSSKYSKANLVWLFKNGKHETDKRFTKDLRRYYRDFDEFMDDMKK